MKNVNEPLIQKFDSREVSGVPTKSFIILLLIVIFFGVASGFILSKVLSSLPGEETKTVQKTAGIEDKKTFKDSAEGILKEGGIEGEGNFHLERPGGESQNVYLTSSTVDLSPYIGKKVRVWGATFKGEKAGWLMDVGLVETL